MNAMEADKRYRHKGGERPVELCCDTFWYAMQSGTDAEGYGALIGCWGDEFRFNSSIQADRLVCPWCGNLWPEPPAD